MVGIHIDVENDPFSSSGFKVPRGKQNIAIPSGYSTRDMSPEFYVCSSTDNLPARLYAGKDGFSIGYSTNATSQRHKTFIRTANTSAYMVGKIVPRQLTYDERGLSLADFVEDEDIVFFNNGTYEYRKSNDNEGVGGGLNVRTSVVSNNVYLSSRVDAVKNEHSLVTMYMRYRAIDSIAKSHTDCEYRDGSTWYECFWFGEVRQYAGHSFKGDGFLNKINRVYFDSDSEDLKCNVSRLDVKEVEDWEWVTVGNYSYTQTTGSHTEYTYYSTEEILFGVNTDKKDCTIPLIEEASGIQTDSDVMPLGPGFYKPDSYAKFYKGKAPSPEVCAAASSWGVLCLADLNYCVRLVTAIKEEDEEEDEEDSQEDDKQKEKKKTSIPAYIQVAPDTPEGEEDDPTKLCLFKYSDLLLKSNKLSGSDATGATVRIKVPKKSTTVEYFMDGVVGANIIQGSHAGSHINVPRADLFYTSMKEASHRLKPYVRGRLIGSFTKESLSAIGISKSDDLDVFLVAVTPVKTFNSTKIRRRYCLAEEQKQENQNPYYRQTSTSMPKKKAAVDGYPRLLKTLKTFWLCDDGVYRESSGEMALRIYGKPDYYNSRKVADSLAGRLTGGVGTAIALSSYKTGADACGGIAKPVKVVNESGVAEIVLEKYPVRGYAIPETDRACYVSCDGYADELELKAEEPFVIPRWMHPAISSTTTLATLKKCSGTFASGSTMDILKNIPDRLYKLHLWSLFVNAFLSGNCCFDGGFSYRKTSGETVSAFFSKKFNEDTFEAITEEVLGVASKLYVKEESAPITVNTYDYLVEDGYPYQDIEGISLYSNDNFIISSETANIGIQFTRCLKRLPSNVVRGLFTRTTSYGMTDSRTAQLLDSWLDALESVANMDSFDEVYTNAWPRHVTTARSESTAGGAPFYDGSRPMRSRTYNIRACGLELYDNDIKMHVYTVKRDMSVLKAYKERYNPYGSDSKCISLYPYHYEDKCPGGSCGSATITLFEIISGSRIGDEWESAPMTFYDDEFGRTYTHKFCAYISGSNYCSQTSISGYISESSTEDVAWAQELLQKWVNWQNTYGEDRYNYRRKVPVSGATDSQYEDDGGWYVPEHVFSSYVSGVHDNVITSDGVSFESFAGTYGDYEGFTSPKNRATLSMYPGDSIFDKYSQKYDDFVTFKSNGFGDLISEDVYFSKRLIGSVRHSSATMWFEIKNFIKLDNAIAKNRLGIPAEVL